MDRLSHGIARASQELLPSWTDERNERLLASTVRRQRRSAARRVVVLSAATFAAAAFVGVALERMLHPEPELASPVATNATNAQQGGHSLRLADGSRADMVGSQSELEATHNSPDRIELHLLAGRAHFDVVPNPRRSFVVEVPPYRVQVIGTIFDVERSQRDVSVTVTRGKVRVIGPRGEVDLRVGESQHFDLGAAAVAAQRIDGGTAAPQPAADESAASEEPEDAQRRPGHTRIAPVHSGWRSLSQSGQYDAAFESLSQNGGAVQDEPAALMDAADAARLSGHPETAVRYLTRVARSHRRSKVAPLAAFTLGRVYLEELGQPDRASDAFALAQELAPTGSMAQDALAREVEALSKAGNAQQAFIRAQKYLSRYPNGRRRRAVQLYGGID